MSRQDIRIELPVANPDGTLTLIGKAAERNTALGASSPVKDDFDWVTIGTDITATQALVDQAKASDRLSQRQHYQALKLLGIAPNQNLQSTDTVYPLLIDVRDILLVKNQTNPEELSLWGFNVTVDTVGGKRVVTVDIPTESPVAFIQLCKDVIAQHTALGAGSPLTGKVDMAFMSTGTTNADTAFKNAEEERGVKESKNELAMHYCGYAEGQNSETVGTFYNTITNLRDLLLVAYRNNPEQLTLWGFDVVVGETAMGDSAKPEPTPPPVP